MNNCPDCGGPNTVAKTEVEILHHGEARITLEVPVNECKDCGFEYFNHEAELARDNAVLRHLALQNVEES